MSANVSYKGVVVSAMLAITVSALSPSAMASGLSRLTITQLTSTPNCNLGTFYPSVDGSAQMVAFSSFCDLVPGDNTDGNSELYLMKANGTGLKQLTSSIGGIGVYGSALALNGQKIVFAADRDLVSGSNTDLNSEIFVINVDGSGLKQITQTTGGDPANFGGNSHPRIGPKAQKITFSSDRDLLPGSNADGNHELFLVNVDGSGVAQLTHTTGGYGVFDQGGLDLSETKVIFDCDRDLVAGGNSDGNADIFVMNVNGTGLTQLTSTVGGSGDIGPRWTPDGQTVTFWSDRDPLGNNADGDFEVFRMKGDGTGLAQITAGTGGFGAAPWGISADGKTISIESDRDLVPGSNAIFNSEIYLASLRP